MADEEIREFKLRLALDTWEWLQDEADKRKSGTTPDDVIVELLERERLNANTTVKVSDVIEAIRRLADEARRAEAKPPTA